MGRIDTRGSMDGALRGFDVMDRHLARKENAERQRSRDEENDRRYWAAEKLNKRKAEASMKASEAQVKASESASKYNAWKEKREQRIAYLTDNSPIIQGGWDKFIQTGELDPVFDNEHVKGGAYDPRRYTDGHFQAAKQLQTVIPQLKNNELKGDDPALIQPLSAFYAENIKTGIGDADPDTGKVIADKKLRSVNPVHDIDPNAPGDQPGLVLTLDVVYDDGSVKPKPVTPNRSTDPNESVLVIPMNKAMADLTSQMKMANAASQRLFSNPELAREDTKEYRRAMMENDQWFATQSASIDNNSMIQDKTAAKEVLYQQYQERDGRIKQLFGQQQSGKPDEFSVTQWAGSDPEKLKFLQAAGQKVDLSKATPGQVDATYQQWMQNQKVADNIIEQETAFEREKNARMAQT